MEEKYNLKGNFEKRISDPNNWIFLHLKNGTNENWINTRNVVKQIPKIGEYIFVDFDGPAYEVLRVDHTIFVDSEFDAEVWAKKVDYDVNEKLR